MSSTERSIVVAIDGPAASGKSSTARAVAAEMGYRYLDSGAFYRAITLAALRAGIAPDRWEELTAQALRDLGVEWTAAPDGFQMRIHGRDATDDIRSPEVNAQVSRMAAVPAVREWLLSALRSAGEAGGLVADGRDIGTVVFPEAELKVFLVCDPAERARRRLRQEGGGEGDDAAVAAEARRLAERDRQDSTRAVAPLLRAADAVQLDTTTLSFEAQVRAITRLARERARG